jgi:hypothetical protein
MWHHYQATCPSTIYDLLQVSFNKLGPTTTYHILTQPHGCTYVIHILTGL